MNIELIDARCSVAYLGECFELCESTGVLVWKIRPTSHFKTMRDCNAWNTKNAGKVAGVKKPSGRVELTVKDRKYRAHRVVWAMHFGQWPENEVDHKDCDPGNNAPSNLRVATRLQNQGNLKLSNQNTSGFKGVVWFSARSKFKAQIKVNGKCIHLGLFVDPQEAHQAYCVAADKFHGEFANYGH